MAIHVRTWSGTGSARITDTTNAGKRGKVCRVLRFSGWLGHPTTDQQRSAIGQTLSLQRWFDSLSAVHDFDEVRAELLQRIQSAGLSETLIAAYDEEIRSIEAPRVKLSAGVENQWSASADEDGISLLDHSDQYNLPAAVTHRQTPAKAYSIAAKVWGQLSACQTFCQAQRVLSDAGCKLHYYCRMD